MKKVNEPDGQQSLLDNDQNPSQLVTGETKRERKIVDSSAEISLQGPEGKDIGYYHSVLCQVGLPRSKVAGTEFERKSGKSWISIAAGKLDEGKGPVQQPIPFGVIPRLILAYISSFAVKNKTCEIPIGDSAADFMIHQLGISTDGKRYKAVRMQMHALAAMRMQFGLNFRTYNGQPIQDFTTWVSKTDKQRSIWPGKTVITEEFYKSLIMSAVPLDKRALAMLKGTALGLDMYVWFAQRLYNLDRKLPLSWVALKEQFGQEYLGANGLQNFRDEFTLKLRIVKAAYPQANVQIIRGGIELSPSDTPIPPKIVISR
ncbi:replication protein RepA [Janthinobacterium sp. MDT1-19]|uniref:replication protein RepA n=1 Tax=Janthinobacterium sp. MDT1-19 TaxID=1259339 RepID=UPI003F21F004